MNDILMRTRQSRVRRIAAFLVISALLLGLLPLSATSADAASSPVVDIASTPGGYLVLHANGAVDAASTPHLGNANVNKAATLSVTPSGSGYWIADAAGAVYAFGDAVFSGDLRSVRLAQPIIAMATTPSGRGYWLVGADGGVFAFGDASFHGSMGGVALASPVVDITATASGRGYWLVGADGGVFAFGDAAFYGSLGGLVLDRPVIGITRSTTGRGYFMVGADGGVFAFGDAPFLGSIGGTGRNDVTALSPTRSGGGYYVASTGGDVVGFGDAISGPAAAEANLLQRVNAERAQRGRSALAWDPNLAAAAESWARDMSRNGLRHSNLNAVQVSMPSPYAAMGENIYWGSAHLANTSSAHQWLMNSTSHRSSIVDTAYTSVGIGIACVDGEMWVAQLFERSAANGNPQWAGTAPSNPRANLTGLADVGC